MEKKFKLDYKKQKIMLLSTLTEKIHKRHLIIDSLFCFTKHMSISISNKK